MRAGQLSFHSQIARRGGALLLFDYDNEHMLVDVDMTARRRWTNKAT